MSTLAELREKVRQRADQESSQFIKDPELTAYINNSYAELYDLLVSRFEDYYCKDPVPFTLTSLVPYYIVPADLYKIRGIDSSVGGTWVTVYPFNFLTRNNYSVGVRPRMMLPSVRYRLMGQKILFTPVDQAPNDYQLWYIPRYTPLVNDADVLSDVLDFEEYIIIDSAIKCMVKEETDPQVLLLMKNQTMDRIQKMASNRDSGMPQCVSDVKNSYGVGNSPFGWF